MQLMDFHGEINKEAERLPSMEHILGKTTMQPFANANSGSRKIMFGTQLEQTRVLKNPEMPIVQTGYEIRFGDRSSSIIKAENELEVIDKISKFSDRPNHHYYLILRDLKTGEFDYIERKEYNHITESFGYLYNNATLDSLDIGYEIPKGEILRKSNSFDDYMNRCDGVNLLVGYIGSDKTMEDAILISESAAQKLSSPLIKEVRVLINDNDILLNLLGDSNTFKSFADIGEEIRGGILCAIRREKIEDSLYMQSIDMLSTILMSDDKFTVEGTVVDISVHCNNPTSLQEKYSNCQIAHYYDEHRRFNREIIQTVETIKKNYGEHCPFSLKLQKMYYNAVEEEKGTQFVWDKPYSGTTIIFHVMEDNIPKKGDKITNRYGGKGVVSEVVPDHLMPQLDNGKHLEVCFNSSTCVNRLNQGQLKELSLTFMSSRIIQYLSENVITAHQAIDMITRFLKHISNDEANAFNALMYSGDTTPEDREWYIDQMIEDGYIAMSSRPISESLTLDNLNEIYKEFPFIKPYTVQTQMKDSNGNYRPVNGRRPLVCGALYIYRLKQHAEEKFSVTSLSSTNIRNENTKNKANKNYKALHTNTPIRFGEMETEDFMHMGAEYVISNLMIHSVSPQARRLIESALTGNPYNVDIVLNSDSKNRSVEILNAYLKTMGLRIKFEKKKKKLIPLMTPSERKEKPLIPLMTTKLDPNQNIKAKVYGKERKDFILEALEKSKKYLMKERLILGPSKPLIPLMTPIKKKDKEDS